MTVRNTIRLIVYRIHEKGLEVLLTKTEGTDANWILLNAKHGLEQLGNKPMLKSYIELNGPDGKEVNAIAIEADWHELPRVRELIAKDIDFVKNNFPEIEGSAYVVVKEAFKKMLPHEYAFLKELKEILLDRNTVKNI
jgi:hypothetical protein